MTYCVYVMILSLDTELFSYGNTNYYYYNIFYNQGVMAVSDHLQYILLFACNICHCP